MILWLLACASEPVCSTADVPESGPRCASAEEGTLTCAHQTSVCEVGTRNRQVYWQVPEGEAPAEGWPLVIVFQGSFYPADRNWEAEPEDAYGGYAQVELTEALLGGGFAVITPESKLDGHTWWDTNVLPWAWRWEDSGDHRLMLALFDAIDAGAFGPADRLYAAGISSGGYMTSRMASAYPGRFEALAIQSASWATCSGALCDLPAELPADHPPTLFLHGERDLVVPIGTMERYAEALEAQGTDVERVTDPEAGHGWLDAAPAEIPAWFAGPR